MSTGTRPVHDGWKVKGSLASLQHLTVGVEGFRNASTWMSGVTYGEAECSSWWSIHEQRKNKGKDGTRIQTAKMNTRSSWKAAIFKKGRPRAGDTLSGCARTYWFVRGRWKCLQS